MASIIPTLLRVILFPVFALAIFIGYSYTLRFCDVWLPHGATRLAIYGRLIAEGFLSAGAVAAVFSYPLAVVYRHNAFVAALFLTLPVLYFRLPEITDWSRRTAGLVVSGYQIGAFVVLLVGGTALAHRHLSRARRRARDTIPEKDAHHVD